MRVALALALVAANPVVPQLTVPDGQPLPGSPLYRAPALVPYPGAAEPDAAAAYITAGQDEPGYRRWFAASGARGGSVKAFNDYLAAYQVGGIIPTWQLLRTASMWRECGAQPFEVPPSSEWPHVVQTLRYLRDFVIPTVGPVEAVSAYRNPTLNQCAGGAPQSAHQHFQAVDLVPLAPMTRQQLMSRLCAVQRRDGSPYEVGLGFYAFMRFHIDTARFRKWGAAASNEAASCAPPLQQTIARASAPPVASPLIQATAATAAPSAAAVTIVPPVAPPVISHDPLAPLP